MLRISAYTSLCCIRYVARCRGVCKWWTFLISFYCTSIRQSYVGRALYCSNYIHQSVRPSVRLTVASRSSFKMAKHIITQITPYTVTRDSSFLIQKILVKFNGITTKGRRKQVG